MIGSTSATTEKTTRKTEPATILQRIARKDRTAAADCVDNYGNFIWALAKKFTASREEAEAAVLEIFVDIWRYAESGDGYQSAEKDLIALITRRRLIRYLR